MKRIVIVLICTVLMLMTACGNVNEKTEREASTRVHNSVVGKWYQYSSAEGIEIWDFNEEGIYYSTNEKMYGKEDETYEIQRHEYSIEGNTIHMYKEDATLEYTSYGLHLIYSPSYDIKLYEYREDAAKQIPDEWKQEKYYESIKDENGCVIEDGVLIRYYTEDKEIIIPDNVITIGSAVIVREAGDIDKLTIPGTVKS